MSVMDSPPGTPISSLSHTVATPSLPSAPKKKPQQSMARFILHSLEDVSEMVQEIILRREYSQEALNAERERKMRILMSLR